MELSRLAEFATCPVRERHWFVSWLKGLQVLGRESLNIPISKPSFRRNSYCRGLTEKSCRLLNLLANIGSLIAKAHQLNYSLYLLCIYFYRAKVCLFTSFNSMYNSMPCRSRVHRDRGLKANHSLAKEHLQEQVTFGVSTFDEPQSKPLFYGYTYKTKVWSPFLKSGLHGSSASWKRCFSNPVCTPVLVINISRVYEILTIIFLYWVIISWLAFSLWARLFYINSNVTQAKRRGNFRISQRTIYWRLSHLER